jgi:hypothetical protein
MTVGFENTKPNQTLIYPTNSFFAMEDYKGYS